MMRLQLVAIGCLALAAGGCKEKAKDAPAGAAPTTGAPTAATSSPAKDPVAGDLYFRFTVDGKALTIAPDAISSSFNTFGKHSELKIFAGNEGEPQVLLTVVSPMTGPSKTPSGSPVVEEGISQGSVGYTAAGVTTVSYDKQDPVASVVAPDAIVITSIEPAGTDARIVTGTFSTKTYVLVPPDATHQDHVLAGEFRIKHLLAKGAF